MPQPDTQTPNLREICANIRTLVEDLTPEQRKSVLRSVDELLDSVDADKNEHMAALGVGRATDAPGILVIFSIQAKISPFCVCDGFVHFGNLERVMSNVAMKPRLGDVQYVAEWYDAAKWENMARAEGWQPGESLWDYVEGDNAIKRMTFSTLAAAKSWAEKNAQLDEYQTPFVSKQVYSDDGYGPPYSWETETWEIWDDGEWSEAN